MSTQRCIILATGANGMVGSYVREVFSDCRVILTDVVGTDTLLDVRDTAAVFALLKDLKPSLVLHLAAATDVDRCEQDPDWAYAINAIGTQNLALACEATDTLMVYLSTGNVFSGEKTEPYTEFDIPNPANVYGGSKLAGEQIMSSLLRRYYIVRAGWMLGGGQKDIKFVGKVTQMILSGNNQISIVDDKFGSPTYARDLLAGVRQLVDKGYYGLYHMVNPGMVSRYDVALEMRGILKHPNVEVVPISSEHFPTPAARIRMEALRNYKLELLGLDWMRPWGSALEAYLVDDLGPSLSSAA